MTDSSQTNVEKKTYIKPQLTEVRLVAQEAVLALCKNNNGGFNRGECTPDPGCSNIPRS